MHSSLLMSDEVVSDALTCPPKFIVNVEYSATGIPKDCIDTFEAQCFDQDFGTSRQRLFEVFIAQRIFIYESFGYHDKPEKLPTNQSGHQPNQLMARVD
jgi:hypothetical protein